MGEREQLVADIRPWPEVTDYVPGPPTGVADFNRARLHHDEARGGGYYVVDDHRVTAEVYNAFQDQWVALYRAWRLFCVMAGLSDAKITALSVREDLRWHQAEVKRLRERLALLEPEEPARPEQCPKCGSDDPKVCAQGGERHGQFDDWDDGCCPDLWHSGGGQ